MVPVEISLSNFLSYGPETQTLDFSRFHVACLSGKNGQGKSALLDGITWALWGEARKSSGAQKPDEELLRIGARRMKIEFLFDVEGERYRVIRAYSKSATGKTTKSELEFQLIGQQGEKEVIPLTGASIRETQEKLNEHLGLDYDAFVNSSMLLQGRSDEFTKKRPAERKNILGRILNLSKYDRLADKARLKQQALNTELEKTGRDIEIFSKVLEDETHWEAELVQVSKSLANEEDHLTRFREEEANISEQVGIYQALTGEYESVKEASKKTQSQLVERREELLALVHKIEGAQKLIVSKSDIQAEYENYISLLAERDELDTQRDVYRGLEKQLESARSSLKIKRTEIDGSIERQEVELRHKEQAYADVKAEIEKKGNLLTQLEQAKEAKVKLQSLLSQVEKREKVENEIRTIEKKILSEREHLSGILQGIQEQLRSTSDKEQTIVSLEKELKEISRDLFALKELQNDLSEITEAGQDIRDEINQLEMEKGLAESERKKSEQRIDQLASHKENICPTCGNELDNKQRSVLLDRSSEELKRSEEAYKKITALLGKKISDREALREKYKELSLQVTALAERTGKELQLKERVQQYKEDQKQFWALREKEHSLNQILINNAFAREEQNKLEVLKKEWSQFKIDEKDLSEIRFQSAQVDRFEEKIRAISFSEGKRDHLKNQIEGLREKIVELRRTLDSGIALKELKEAIANLEKKLAESPFNPERYEFVRDGLKRGRQIPDRMKDLVNAEQNLEEWQVSRQRLEHIVDEISATQRDLSQKKVDLEEQLESGKSLKEQLISKKKERDLAEGRIIELQRNKGEAQARLSQIKEAQADLKAAKKVLKELKSELNIYRKLRTAFGKNGIQSLIIEQALPEIEERASEILFRLTEGKMRVHLETIKDKKSGGTKETLEIIITDDQGVPRSYETYSGGEAFRINFALRIALSQMLAERSGVKIRTLGIDEGFGTQDEDGIQYLVEAIQQVQDDFDKIIVITHLDRLKEAFPVRIEVVKDPISGSQLTVIEQ